jgi:curved DNA-binding protein CbpA
LFLRRELRCMTDYFALLDQPRRPWLDLEQLKETFHAKTLRAHPDAQSPSRDSSEGAFTELNEAYQVLRDPKRRLHHYLTLEGTPPSSHRASIPPEIEVLFPAIADLTHEADALVQKSGTAASALSRSLLKPQLLAVAKRVNEMLVKLKELDRNLQSELRELSQKDEITADSRAEKLHAFYLQFSYLTNWIAQLEEKQLHLVSTV